MFLALFLFFRRFKPWCFYRKSSLKKKCSAVWNLATKKWNLATHFHCPVKVVRTDGDGVFDAQCTMDWMTKKLKHWVPGQFLLRLLVCSYRSLIRLLRTARCAHSFTLSLIPELMGKWFLSLKWLLFYHFYPLCNGAFNRSGTSCCNIFGYCAFI